VVSRMLAALTSCATQRSSPMAKPPSGGMPYLNASREPASGSGSRPRALQRRQVVLRPEWSRTDPQAGLRTGTAVGGPYPVTACVSPCAR
jgi:hypothetical protein